MPRRKLPSCKLSKDHPISEQIFYFFFFFIVENFLVPTDKISENEIAEHFDVSRMPVRAAINELINCGLVEVFPQKGSFVTKISAKNLKDICFMRCAIECQALRESLNLNDKDFNKIINKLERIMQKQRNLTDSISNKSHGKFLSLDDNFHSTICQFSSTQLAWDTIQKVKSNMDRIRYFTIHENISSINTLVNEHDELFACIKNKDIQKAIDLLSKHLYEITKTYHIVRKNHNDWFLEE